MNKSDALPVLKNEVTKMEDDPGDIAGLFSNKAVSEFHRDWVNDVNAIKAEIEPNPNVFPKRVKAIEPLLHDTLGLKRMMTKIS